MTGDAADASSLEIEIGASVTAVAGWGAGPAEASAAATEAASVAFPAASAPATSVAPSPPWVPPAIVVNVSHGRSNAGAESAPRTSTPMDAAPVSDVSLGAAAPGC